MKRVLTGTATAPAIWMPQNASAQSLPLRQADGDPVAPPDARGPQATGDTRRAVPELLVGDPLAAELDERLVVGARWRPCLRSMATSDGGSFV